MVKRMFSLPEGDYEWLRAEAERAEVSLSEFLRRVVAAERRRQRRKDSVHGA